MVPEFVDRTRGSQWVQAQPAGSQWQSALPTGSQWVQAQPARPGAYHSAALPRNSTPSNTPRIIATTRSHPGLTRIRMPFLLA